VVPKKKKKKKKKKKGLGRLKLSKGFHVEMLALRVGRHDVSRNGM